VDALAAQGDADAATRLDEAVLAVRTAGTGLSRGVPDRAKEEEPWDTR
jgi:hypothetical protein